MNKKSEDTKVTKAQPNREAYGETLVDLGRLNKGIYVLDADLSKSTYTKLFNKAYPERFINVGVAEQNGMSFAAGLAAVEKTVFFSTFAVFASMRACDQVRQSIAYPKMNVKIVATSAGIENNADGVTHQAIEDIAIMRAIPNMTVLSPSDPVTTKKAVIAAARHNGPVYIRLGRHVSEKLYPEDIEYKLGKMIRLRDGKDVTIIATGRLVHEAIQAASILEKEGLEARVLDCHTVKPIDKDEIICAAKETKGIVTAEDHNILGGLGGAVSEIVCSEVPCNVKRVGVHDEFAGSAKDYRELFKKYGLDYATIIKKVKEIFGGTGYE
jgi:transketolase